jgi:hypothetical protein
MAQAGDLRAAGGRDAAFCDRRTVAIAIRFKTDTLVQDRVDLDLQVAPSVPDAEGRDKRELRRRPDSQTEDRMRIQRSKIGLVLATTLAACSGAEPLSPHLPATPSLNNGEGIVVHASGSGELDLSSAGVPNATFQFVAKRRTDGTAFGHFRMSRPSAAGLVEFEGVVTCLTVDANFPGRARIGGKVTVNNSTAPGSLTENHEVGDDVWFRVQDTGTSDADQRSTTYGFKPVLVDTSEQYCALPFDGLPAWNPASIFPLASGVIRVKQ